MLKIRIGQTFSRTEQKNRSPTMKLFHKKSHTTYNQATKTPVIKCSICTGEPVIGFRSKTNGRLLNAVAVHNRADIAAFYRSYGFSYTGKFDK